MSALCTLHFVEGSGQVQHPVENPFIVVGAGEAAPTTAGVRQDGSIATGRKGLPKMSQRSRDCTIPVNRIAFGELDAAESLSISSPVPTGKRQP